MRIWGLQKQETGSQRQLSWENDAKRNEKGYYIYLQGSENDLFQLSFIQFHSHKSDKLLPTISSVLVALKPRMLKEIVVCINMIPRIASCRTDKVNNVTESQSHLWVFQWVGWSHNNFWIPLWRRPLKYSLMDYCYGCAFIIINRTLQSEGKRYGFPDTWKRKWVYFIFC